MIHDTNTNAPAWPGFPPERCLPPEEYAQLRSLSLARLLELQGLINLTLVELEAAQGRLRRAEETMAEVQRHALALGGEFKTLVDPTSGPSSEETIATIPALYYRGKRP